MKFVHIADMHFDIPFTVLEKNNLGEVRRLEQREVFKKVINYIIENNVEYLFICGDLYEHEYIRQSTIDFINNQFKKIANTKIYIVPGNHDPYIKNSYYESYNWNENVFIFKDNLEIIENENINIYGYGFNDFYLKSNKLEEITYLDISKVNILLTHGDLDGASGDEKEYNPIYKKDLQKFNYVALGHIHKRTEINNSSKIVYSGSTISLGFDETGSHGMVVGEIKANKDINLEFIPLDEKEFVELEIDASLIYNVEELIEEINSKYYDENKYYKIILVGNRNFEFNLNDILKFILNRNIIKIKDFRKLEIDLEKLSLENSLKGIFVKNILEKIKENPEEKDKLLRVIEIGLDSM